MNLSILLLILYLNFDICSNVENENEQDRFEEPTDSDFERELEEDKRFIEEQELYIKICEERSKESDENIRRTFKKIDDLFKKINDRQPS
jgi:hypothetical protein